MLLAVIIVLSYAVLVADDGR